MYSRDMSLKFKSVGFSFLNYQVYDPRRYVTNVINHYSVTDDAGILHIPQINQHQIDKGSKRYSCTY